LGCHHHIFLEALTKTTENINHDSRLLDINRTVNHSGIFFAGSRVVLKFSRISSTTNSRTVSTTVTHARKRILGLNSIVEYALPCPGVHDAKKRCGTTAKQSKQVMPSTILQRTTISNGDERNLDLQNAFFNNMPARY